MAHAHAFCATSHAAEKAKKHRRCQVPGCQEDFVRPYNLKKRLCDLHMKADAVLREGYGTQLWRYCQQCGKLEELYKFEGCKRSCAMALVRKRAHSAAAKHQATGHVVSVADQPTTQQMDCCNTASSAAASLQGEEQQIAQLPHAIQSPTQMQVQEQANAEAASRSSSPPCGCWTAPFDSMAVPAAAPVAAAPAAMAVSAPLPMLLPGATSASVPTSDIVEELTEAFFSFADDATGGACGGCQQQQQQRCGSSMADTEAAANTWAQLLLADSTATGAVAEDDDGDNGDDDYYIDDLEILLQKREAAAGFDFTPPTCGSFSTTSYTKDTTACAAAGTASMCTAASLESAISAALEDALVSAVAAEQCCSRQVTAAQAAVVAAPRQAPRGQCSPLFTMAVQQQAAMSSAVPFCLPPSVPAAPVAPVPAPVALAAMNCNLQLQQLRQQYSQLQSAVRGLRAIVAEINNTPEAPAGPAWGFIRSQQQAALAQQQLLLF